MNNALGNMIAQLESWESAAEFNIPEEEWAGYVVRNRTDDLYISAFSAIFESLREEDANALKSDLRELAKTLLIYSKSAAARYIKGVDPALNLIYAAACFYISDYPATATLILKDVSNSDSLLDEEKFLYTFLLRSISSSNSYEELFSDVARLPTGERWDELTYNIRDSMALGLKENPRLYIASKLLLKCLERYCEYSVGTNLSNFAHEFLPEVWGPFLFNEGTFSIWELFPSQKIALQNGILSNQDEVYSLQMPTSSGKTSLCEIVIFNEVRVRQKKVLFIVPFRALAAEIKAGISTRLQLAGINVLAAYGGNIPTRSEGQNIETTDVLIVTPEKLVAISQMNSELLAEFKTVICDEGHLIDDRSRGFQYEILLTRLKSNEDIRRKIVFISAILPNIDEIHAWLGGGEEALSVSEYKPVEIDYAILRRQQKDYWQLSFNTIHRQPKSYFLRNFIVKDDLRFINRDTGNRNLLPQRDSPAMLASISALKSRKHGAVAIFTTQKGPNGVSGLTNAMLRLFENDAFSCNDDFQQSEALEQLRDYIGFQFGTTHKLRALLSHGIGFHHGDLPQEIRREMEEGIQGNLFNILICTTTLAEGVNLPIRTLVMHTIRRFNGQIMEPIKLRNIKNIVGRVGRAGKEARGRVIFVNSDEQNIAESVFRDERMEPAKGALFNLIRNIDQSIRELNIQLSNDLFESQNPEFLSILDRIDMALIDLVPGDMDLNDFEDHLGDILESTLAFRYCDTDELRARMAEVFRLRSQHIQESIDVARWPALKSSGASPRYFNYLEGLEVVKLGLWTELEDVLDEHWLEEVVLEVKEYPLLDLEDIEDDLLLQVIRLWLSGRTYFEISTDLEIEFDDALEVVCSSIGYKLQESMSKVIQLAINSHGENISEIALNWSSLLQYGLGTLQQLDLFERGATDRLAVWGIQRYLEANNVQHRRNQLLRFLRNNSEAVRSHLEQDARVPMLSFNRICEELSLS